jgi:adenosine deaminase
MAVNAQDPISCELRQLPKAELHRHLECSMRFSTILELAPQVGIEVPKNLASAKHALLVTEPMNDLESVLRKFMATQAVLHSEEILTRITEEVIEDAYAEGIRILELRYAPTFIMQGHDNLNFEKIHTAIVKGMESAKKRLPIAVGLIGTLQRILPVKTNSHVTDFIIDHKDTFVAMDLADNEVGFEPAPFAPLFARARKAGLHITVHAGESNVPQAPDYVRDAIELLGAERIGHGLQIYKSSEVIEFVKERRVALELCPTSNWLTNAVDSTAHHPFRFLMEHGVAVTINSDDPGVFDADLVNEYRVLKTEHALTQDEFAQINDMAAAFSFIPDAEKQKAWPRKIVKGLSPWS